LLEVVRVVGCPTLNGVETPVLITLAPGIPAGGPLATPRVLGPGTCRGWVDVLFSKAATEFGTSEPGLKSWLDADVSEVWRISGPERFEIVEF
jgi:hypothetical protein